MTCSLPKVDVRTHGPVVAVQPRLPVFEPEMVEPWPTSRIADCEPEIVMALADLAIVQTIVFSETCSAESAVTVTRWRTIVPLLSVVVGSAARLTVGLVLRRTF